MPSRERKLVVLLVLGCLLTAQVHVWADLDPCLLKSSTSHSGPNHNHRCQGCESGNLMVAGGLPSLAPLSPAAQIDPLLEIRLSSEQRADGRSPRAPPRS